MPADADIRLNFEADNRNLDIRALISELRQVQAEVAKIRQEFLITGQDVTKNLSNPVKRLTRDINSLASSAKSAQREIDAMLNAKQRPRGPGGRFVSDEAFREMLQHRAGPIRALKERRDALNASAYSQLNDPERGMFVGGHAAIRKQQQLNLEARKLKSELARQLNDLNVYNKLSDPQRGMFVGTGGVMPPRPPPVQFSRVQLTEIERLTKLAAQYQNAAGIQIDPTNKWSAALENTGKKARGAANEISFLSNAGALFLGLSLYRGFGLLTSSVSQALQQIIAFDKAMHAVAAVAQVSNYRIAQLTEDMKKLALAVPQSPSELGMGLYSTLQAGFLDSADAAQILSVASKAAVGGLTNTQVAVKVLTTALQSYQKNAYDVAQVSDMLFEAQRRGNFAFEELENAFGMVLPVASAYGVQLDEVAAALSIMTKRGINAGKAATYIRQFFLALATPTRDAKELSKIFDVDFSAEAVRTKGLTGILEEFTNKLNLGSTAAKRLMLALDDEAAAVKVLTDELNLDVETATRMFTTMRGIMTIVSLSGSNFQDYKFDLEAIRKSYGSTDRAAAKMTESLDAQYKLLQTRVLVALDPLKDALMLVAQGLNGLFDVLSFLRPIILPVASALGLLTAHFLALKVAERISPAIIDFTKALQFQGSQVARTRVGLVALGAGLAGLVGAYMAAKNGQEDLLALYSIETGVTVGLATAYFTLAAARSASIAALAGPAGVGIAITTAIASFVLLKDQMKKSFDPAEFRQIGKSAAESLGDAMLEGIAKHGILLAEQIDQIKKAVNDGFGTEGLLEGKKLPITFNPKFGLGGIGKDIANFFGGLPIFDKIKEGYQRVETRQFDTFKNGIINSLKQAITTTKSATDDVVAETFRLTAEEFNALAKEQRDKLRQAYAVQGTIQTLEQFGLKTDEALRRQLESIIAATYAYDDVGFTIAQTADGLRIFYRELAEAPGKIAPPKFDKTFGQLIIDNAKEGLSKLRAMFESQDATMGPAFQNVLDAVSGMTGNFSDLSSTTQDIIIGFVKLKNTLEMLNLVATINNLGKEFGKQFFSEAQIDQLFRGLAPAIDSFIASFSNPAVQQAIIEAFKAEKPIDEEGIRASLADKTKDAFDRIESIRSGINSFGNALRESRDRLVLLGYSAGKLNNILTKEASLNMLLGTRDFLQAIEQLSQGTGVTMTGLAENIKAVETAIIEAGQVFVNELTGVNLVQLAKDMASEDMSKVMEDRMSALSSGFSALEESIVKWQVQILGVGYTTQELQKAIGNIARLNVIMGTLEFLNAMREISKGAGKSITGLETAITTVQEQAIAAGQSFVDFLSKDPRKLAEILANQNYISQTIDNKVENNITIRISGDENLDPARAATFADALMNQLAQRQSIKR